MTPRNKTAVKTPPTDFKESVSDALNNEEVVDTKKKGRKPKAPEENKEYYDRADKVFSASGTTHKVFLNVKDAQKIDFFTPIGTRVLVARYPDFYKLYLYAYHRPGEVSYPLGGIRVWNEVHGQVQAFYYESVAIHPDGGTLKRFNKNSQIEVDNSTEVKDSEDTKRDEKE